MEKILLLLSVTTVALALVPQERHTRREDDTGRNNSRDTRDRIENRPRVIQYDHFEDYLIESLNPAAVERERQRQISQSQDRESQEEATNTLDILGYFRDLPREHWSCCMLGKLAGDKGFHCQAQFYAARMSMRNRNRAHNAKMHFHGRYEIPQYGKELMFTFRRCVNHRHKEEFNKCCYAASVELTERERWQVYIWNHQNTTTTTPQESRESHDTTTLDSDSPHNERQRQRQLQRQMRRQMQRQNRDQQNRERRRQ